MKLNIYYWQMKSLQIAKPKETKPQEKKKKDTKRHKHFIEVFDYNIYIC